MNVPVLSKPEPLPFTSKMLKGRATLLEAAKGVTVEEVVAATEADLAVSPELIKPTIPKAASGAVYTSIMGEAL